MRGRPEYRKVRKTPHIDYVFYFCKHMRSLSMGLCDTLRLVANSYHVYDLHCNVIWGAGFTQTL